MFVDGGRELSTSAELLRSARAVAALSQAELGRRAGVPRTMVSAYERDLRQPTLSTLRRLLRAAGFELQVQLVRHPDPDEVLRTMEEQFVDSGSAAENEEHRSAQARLRRAAAERDRQNRSRKHGSA